MRYTLGFTALALALSNVSAAPVPTTPAARLVYQFPTGTFVENIACRSNGHLLLDVLSEPVVYTIDPTASKISAKIVYRFPNATGISGIAETNTPDVFAVIAGNWTLATKEGTLGSFSVWSLDFRSSDQPIATKIASISDTNNLNGMATIPGSPNIILLADSAKGAVWTLDIETKLASITIQEPSFQPSASIPGGINGINTYGGQLYFTSSAQGVYGSVPINNQGFATGPVKEIAHINTTEGTIYDDFAMDSEGNAFIAIHPDRVERAPLSGEQTILVQGSLPTDLAGPTSATFGRGSVKEESTLYVSAGGVYNASGSVLGGQVLAVDNVL